jgi:hypothetical protein
MDFTFSIHETAAMAQFVCQLVREGVTFKINRLGENFTITLTGGF